MLIPRRTFVSEEYGAGISLDILNCLNNKQKVNTNFTYVKS